MAGGFDSEKCKRKSIVCYESSGIGILNKIDARGIVTYSISARPQMADLRKSTEISFSNFVITRPRARIFTA